MYSVDKLAVMRHKVTRRYILSHIPKGSLVLDIGIGSGRYWDIFNDRYEIHGCDLLHGCDLTRYVADIQDDNIKEIIHARYQYVTMFEVIEHLENPVRALKNVKDLMIEGGTFIGSTPNRFDPYLWLGAKMHPDHNYIFDRLSLSHLLQKCGFKVLKIDSKVLPLKLSSKVFIPVDFSKILRMGRVLFWIAKAI